MPFCIERSSPRAWGCFLITRSEPPGDNVFPTCVGVFPFEKAKASDNWGLPHVRGGVSISKGLNVTPPKSSPRAWGCFGN